MAGNSNTSVNKTLTIDTINPRLSITYPQNISYTAIPNQLNLQQITPTVIPTIIITPTPVITNLNSNDLNSAAYDINSPFVNVISRGSRQQSDGSGFYIRPNIVVTCAHILSFNNNTVNGNSVQILSINNSKDTALLKVSIRNNSYLSL